MADEIPEAQRLDETLARTDDLLRLTDNLLTEANVVAHLGVGIIGQPGEGDVARYTGCAVSR